MLRRVLPLERHRQAALREDLPNSRSLRPARQRMFLGLIGTAVLAVDLLLVHNEQIVTWVRFTPPAVGLVAIVLSAVDRETLLGFSRIRERPWAVLMAIAILGTYLWVSAYSSPVGSGAVDCRLQERLCTAPYWLAPGIQQLTVLAPLVEESVYRAVGFGALALALGPIPALIISTAAFGFLHHLYGSLRWFHLAAGLAYTGLYWYGRSLALNIATHAAMNWAVMLRNLARWYAYYTP